MDVDVVLVVVIVVVDSVVVSAVLYSASFLRAVMSALILRTDFPRPRARVPDSRIYVFSSSTPVFRSPAGTLVEFIAR